ncbi:MAG: hypothetical protein KTR20_02360, partial [Cellvibrionaceae bacterium]|nr:hypothetical protein [Cellvibrionaceae bacterium]
PTTTTTLPALPTVSLAPGNEDEFPFDSLPAVNTSEALLLSENDAVHMPLYWQPETLQPAFDTCLTQAQAGQACEAGEAGE